jgi:hypothetical protein
VQGPLKKEKPPGIDYVLVNRKKVIDNGKHTGRKERMIAS